MKRYKILGLYGERGRGVYIQSSDAAILKWIAAQIKTVVPNATAEMMTGVWQLPTAKDQGKTYHGDSYTMRLHSLNYRDTDAAWWVIRELCELGWEPLSPSFDLRQQQTVQLYFRLEEAAE